MFPSLFLLTAVYRVASLMHSVVRRLQQQYFDGQEALLGLKHTYLKYVLIIIMIMIICIHKKRTLQIMAKNKQQSHNLGILVKNCKTYLADNYLKTIIILILQI